ncbi:hypothetical protein AMAG_18828 [Allomyces macrogynus ATCC 38327]|uniref:Uncharacterized protein n=1 Tax=Allomyces macrogynus (strain ATCC 38327) TaxID=578462 RepID=A0A0L0SI72_ALLM3|nr:hypothetical protein AMAG_18828 [Allomyces macrogynus ATCC 38327]|eukprot:KNE62213.1 hypothetical protein AMAG_18828 [Allomyces macrogynus ATCC 38327]
MVKLMDITGKIGRSVNCIELRRQLPYTLPELHAMLSEYRRALPASRHFPPHGLDSGHREYQMNAFLSMLYLSAVVSLYRPLCTARSTVIESPLKDQYLALIDASATSMLEVLEAVGGEGKEVGLFPHLPYLSCMILGATWSIVQDLIVLPSTAGGAPPAFSAYFTASGQRRPRDQIEGYLKSARAVAIGRQADAALRSNAHLQSGAAGQPTAVPSASVASAPNLHDADGAMRTWLGGSAASLANNAENEELVAGRAKSDPGMPLGWHRDAPNGVPAVPSTSLCRPVPDRA